MNKPPSRSEQVLLRFNRTDFRVYVLRAQTWQIWSEKRRCGSTYLKALYRRSLVTLDGKLTHLGECYAKRHNDTFYAMRPDTKVLSDETKANMKAARERKRRESDDER